MVCFGIKYFDIKSHSWFDYFLTRFTFACPNPEPVQGCERTHPPAVWSLIIHCLVLTENCFGYHGFLLKMLHIGRYHRPGSSSREVLGYGLERLELDAGYLRGGDFIHSFLSRLDPGSTQPPTK